METDARLGSQWLVSLFQFFQFFGSEPFPVFTTELEFVTVLVYLLAACYWLHNTFFQRKVLHFADARQIVDDLLLLVP